MLPSAQISPLPPAVCWCIAPLASCDKVLSSKLVPALLNGK